jgi:hypothetical protein
MPKKHSLKRCKNPIAEAFHLAQGKRRKNSRRLKEAPIALYAIAVFYPIRVLVEITAHRHFSWCFPDDFLVYGQE